MRPTQPALTLVPALPAAEAGERHGTAARVRPLGRQSRRNARHVEFVALLTGLLSLGTIAATVRTFAHLFF